MLRLIRDDNSEIIEIGTESISLGRNPQQSGAQVNHSSVSGLHCRIIVSGSRDGRLSASFMVIDLESRHGTWVNGKRVTSSPLRNRDQLRLGAVSFTVAIGDLSLQSPRERPTSKESLAHEIADESQIYAAASTMVEVRFNDIEVGPMTVVALVQSVHNGAFQHTDQVRIVGSSEWLKISVLLKQPAVRRLESEWVEVMTSRKASPSDSPLNRVRSTDSPCSSPAESRLVENLPNEVQNAGKQLPRHAAVPVQISSNAGDPEAVRTASNHARTATQLPPAREAAWTNIGFEASQHLRQLISKIAHPSHRKSASWAQLTPRQMRYIAMLLIALGARLLWGRITENSTEWSALRDLTQIHEEIVALRPTQANDEAWAKLSVRAKQISEKYQHLLTNTSGSNHFAAMELLRATRDCLPRIVENPQERDCQFERMLIVHISTSRAALSGTFKGQQIDPQTLIGSE